MYSDPFSLQIIFLASNFACAIIDAKRFISSESVRQRSKLFSSKLLLESVLGEAASPRIVLIPSFDLSGSRLDSLLSITTMSLSSVDNSVATLPPIEPPPSMIIFKSNFP